MKWKVEAGVPADYWFARTLNWVYNVKVIERARLPQPAVVRAQFSVELGWIRELTREDAQAALQSFLDTAPMYNLYVLWASYEPLKEKLTIEIELGKDIFVYDAIMLAGNLIGQSFGTQEVYWDGTCDFAWLNYFEVTAITVGYEIPIAYISEEAEEARVPVLVIGAFAILGLAVLIAQPWKERGK